MITKLATFRGVSPNGDPLVQLFRPEGGVLKLAGTIRPEIQKWMDSYQPDPNELVLLVNAMGASEFWGQNINGDIFFEDALLHDCRKHPGQAHPYDDFTGKILPPYGYWTFLNAHPFVHHRNKDPSRAFGRVALAIWNPYMHRVELIVIIDKKLAMEHGAQAVVDRILAGEFPDVSMGCRVPYDVCTICGHKSKTRNDYCNCIKLIGMGKVLDDGRRIGVINLHPRFFDISFVFIGADKTAKVMCKLASGLWVPASVAEADEVYNIPETADGLIKAACGAGSCRECARGCVVKEASVARDMSIGGAAGALGGAVGVGLTGLLASKGKLTPALAKSIIRAAGEWGIAGATTVGGIHLIKKMSKHSSAESMMASESFQTGTDIPTQHVRARGASMDDRAAAIIEKLQPPPAETELLLSRPDDQENEKREAISDGELETNQNVGSMEDRETQSYERPKTAMSPLGKAGLLGLAAVPVGIGALALRKKTRPALSRSVAQDYRQYMQPVKMSSALTDLFERARDIKVGPPPKPNRKEYPFVGTIDFRGLTVHVENEAGSVREGTGPGGQKWRTEMKLPYGEILGSLGADGDKLDVYVGPYREADNVYIVHQQHARGPKKGKYDEDKVMLGFESPEQAKAAYLAHYDSPDFFRSITSMAFPLFKRVVQRKEVHGEKVADRLFDSWGEAAQAAEEFNADLPSDLAHLLGVTPTKDEHTGKYRIAYRPLSREQLAELADLGLGKTSQVLTKVAAHLHLEELFSSSKTARRRQRTWKNLEGQEVTITGSGLNKELEKKASAPSPEVLKIARVLHNGWEPEDLLKVSNDPKTASHLKWADIVKQIGPSKAVGRVGPLLSDSEPDIPRETLNELGKREDLEGSLATPSLMGMVLKPREFQRMMLSRMGHEPLADRLDDAGQVFKPCEHEVAPCGPLSLGHMDHGIMRMLMSLLGGKSYLGPPVRRRIIRITIIKPLPPKPEEEVESPLLSKVAGAYTWYRREQMKLASEIPRALSSVPELHAGILGLGDAALFKGAAKIDPAVAIGVLGTVPLSLMYSAHKRGQREKGKELGVLGNLVADHPWLTALGVAAGMRELLKSPQGRQAVEEIIQATSRVVKGAPA